MGSLITIVAILATAALSTVPSQAQTWRELTPSSDQAPSARINASAIYDPLGHRMLIFGGRGSSGDVDDLWAFDLATNTWAQITPATGVQPSERYTHNAIYDPDNHQMVVWSGRHLGGGDNILYNEVWAFDLNTDTWSQFTPPDPLPNVRYGTAAVYDPSSKSLVNFAGFTDKGRFNDTWAFDLNANQWIDISPASGRPSVRCLHGASYDSRDHRMLIFGGQNDGGLNDLWAFDLAEQSWTDLSPADRPAGRKFPSTLYDKRRHHFVVFAGERNGRIMENDVWYYDLTEQTWQQLSPAGTPPPGRTGATSIYIEAEDRAIFFGGTGDGNLNDVWSLEQLGPMAVSTAITHSQDEQPDDFTLYPVYPNPFNPATTIRYTLPADGIVRLAVYDILGQPIKSLVAHHQVAGHHTQRWDGRDNSGNAVGSGIYFFQLRAGHRQVTQRAVLLQ